MNKLMKPSTRTNLILILLAVLAGVALYVIWSKHRVVKTANNVDGKTTTDTSVATDQTGTGTLQQLALIQSLQAQIAANTTANPATGLGVDESAEAPDFLSVYQFFKR